MKNYNNTTIQQYSNIPVVFFGASRFVLPIIKFLNNNYDLKLVITTEVNPTDAVPNYCVEHGIPYISASSKQELLAISHTLLAISAPLAVLAYFGLIVTQEIIDIFPKGIVNIHPSLLPKYRGSTPVQTALVLGDAKTGVSVMLLDKDMDHGPILAQQEAEILPEDTAITLYERLFPKGVELLEAVLPAYLTGELEPVEQDHSKATFTKPLTRDSGFLDLSKIDSMSPLEIENLKLKIERAVRAYYPWPGVWTRFTFNHSDPRHPELVSGSQERIVKFLPGKLLQVEGKKPMSYKDFINGYPQGKEFLKKLGLI